MFRCQITGVVSKPGEKPHRVVAQKRDRVYKGFVKNEETLKWEEVVVGHGWEIVKEIVLSNEGLQLWESWSPETQAIFAGNV